MIEDIDNRGQKISAPCFCRTRLAMKPMQSEDDGAGNKFYFARIFLANIFFNELKRPVMP
jgi:hypothetical protein